MYDPLSDIRQYNTSITIAHVMKFCDKKGLSLTRAMVQNYIRLEILSPPVNKRFYTHGHLAVLVLIENLKTVFDMDAIREVLKPFMKEEGVSLEVYERLMAKREEVMKVWEKKIKPPLNDGGDEDFSRLAVMAHVADLKHTPTL